MQFIFALTLLSVVVLEAAARTLALLARTKMLLLPLYLVSELVDEILQIPTLPTKIQL